MKQYEKIKLTSNIVQNDELKAAIATTLDFLADTLSRTLGPYGSNTIIEDGHLRHTISKDGYSLLKRINVVEDVPRVIIDFVKNISRTLVRKVGDGSTSSIMVARSLFQGILEISDKYNVPAKDILDLLNESVKEIEVLVKERSRTLELESDMLAQIAAVSTNNDQDYGKLIASIFQKIGRHGFITLETSKTPETHYEVTNGIEVMRGYIDKNMANQADRRTVELLNPLVFMCDTALEAQDMEWLPEMIGQICLTEGRPLVLVAKSYDTQIATFLQVNMVRNRDMPLLAIDIATQSKRSADHFEDLALSLGCKPYRKLEGEMIKKFSNNVRESLGSCTKVSGTELATQFIQGHGDKEAIEERMNQLEEEINKITLVESRSDFDTDIYDLRKRISNLGNRMAVLHVGGNSEEEKETAKYLVEDAVFACRSALEHGYVIGGNLIIPMIIQENTELLFNKLKEKSNVSPELIADMLHTISNGFESSFAEVLRNAKVENPKEYVDECIDDKKIYNLKSGKFEAEHETNIINSAETDIEIMKSAASIIGLLATSNQFIRLNI